MSNKPKLDESKFKYLNRSKLHSAYLTNFLTEIWNVPIEKLDEFQKEYYPNPSALELVELNELKRVIKKSLPTTEEEEREVIDEETGEVKVKKVKVKIAPELLGEEDWKGQQNRYNRMYGRDVQPINVAGLEGKALALTDMDEEQVKEELTGDILSVLKVASKIVKKKKKK